MASKTILIWSYAAREKIRKGIDTLADTVKVTLGPKDATLYLNVHLVHQASPKMV